jgi:CDGSH-type Zn-finger protein
VEDEATITPYVDGPYIVRGNFRVTDQDGNEIEAGRRTIALCRCGRSQIKPCCDGTHKLVGFRAAGGSEGTRGLAAGNGAAARQERGAGIPGIDV